MAKVSFTFVKEFSGVQNLPVKAGELWKVERDLQQMMTEIHGPGIRITSWDAQLTPEEHEAQEAYDAEWERKFQLAEDFTEDSDGDVTWSAGHEDDLYTDKPMINGWVVLRLQTWGYTNLNMDEDWVTREEVFCAPTCSDIMNFASKYVNSDLTDHVFLEAWNDTGKTTVAGYPIYELSFGS